MEPDEPCATLRLGAASGSKLARKRSQPAPVSPPPLAGESVACVGQHVPYSLQEGPVCPGLPQPPETQRGIEQQQIHLQAPQLIRDRLRSMLLCKRVQLKSACLPAYLASYAA